MWAFSDHAVRSLESSERVAGLMAVEARVWSDSVSEARIRDSVGERREEIRLRIAGFRVPDGASRPRSSQLERLGRPLENQVCS